MKKTISLSFMMLMCVGLVMATAGVGIGINVTPGNTVPQIWMNSASRVLTDALGNPILRMNNYAFTGEQLSWDVLVRDTNGKEDINSVVVTVGQNAGSGNPTEVSCIRSSNQPSGVITWADGISFNSATDELYHCILTVEPGFEGEYWMQGVVDDGDDEANVRENSFFWFNPSIGLQILDAPSGLDFGTVVPGATEYSQTVRLKSIVASGSGVILDVDISGTDFYDPSSSGAMCPTTNALALSSFKYYATKGSYSTEGSPTAVNGYEVIGYNFQNIIRGSGSQASQLTEGSEFALTFQLSLPSPCSGNFISGTIDFEGTAI